ncbi:MAG: hypothetical protein Q7S00_07060, partial [bacterium]|nr:hypothetical protein [bacterium]
MKPPLRVAYKRVDRGYRTNQLNINFEHAGRQEKIVIDVPAMDLGTVHKSDFDTGRIRGNYEVRRLGEQGLQYLLYIDGTGERVTLENGEVLLFKEGVIGFVAPGREGEPPRVFQSAIGRHVSKSMTVRAPANEYYDICERLERPEQTYFTPGESSLGFLTDLNDIDLMLNAVDYACQRAEAKKSTRLAGFVVPVFSNPALPRDKIRAMLEKLLFLAGDQPLREAYPGLLGQENAPHIMMQRFSKTLAVQEVMLEMAIELIQKKTRYRQGIELLEFLKPEKA